MILEVTHKKIFKEQTNCVEWQKKYQKGDLTYICIQDESGSVLLTETIEIAQKWWNFFKKLLDFGGDNFERKNLAEEFAKAFKMWEMEESLRDQLHVETFNMMRLRESSGREMSLVLRGIRVKHQVNGTEAFAIP